MVTTQNSHQWACLICSYRDERLTSFLRLREAADLPVIS